MKDAQNNEKDTINNKEIEKNVNMYKSRISDIEPINKLKCDQSEIV